MGNDLQKTLDFYKKRVEELEKTVVEINKSKFDKLMEKDILFHLKKELEEKDKEIEKYRKEAIGCYNTSENEIFKLKCEIIQLKTQLHTQPKEIVEKIKNFMDENTYYYEEERFAEYIAEYLDKILKEYEEK